MATLTGRVDCESGADFPERAGIVWAVNARLEAQDTTQKWYRGKIIAISESEKQVLVHFDGWNARWDSWFTMDSQRLRPVSKMADWRDKKRENKSPFKINQRVLAKWKGMSFYPAKITGINDNGSFRVLFHDGVEQNTKRSDMKHATSAELSKVEQEIETRQWVQPHTAEGKRARKATKPDDAFIITEPILRRKSTEAAAKPEEPTKKPEVPQPKKERTSSTSSSGARKNKKKTYLKLGQALPDVPAKAGTSKDRGSTERKPADEADDASEETYSSFKASLPKRKRRESQPASGRSTPTDAAQKAGIDSGETESDSLQPSPTKLKVKSALHAKMARVREVCNKWKKDREKRCRKVSRPDFVILSDEDTESASETGSSKDKYIVETVDPFEVACESEKKDEIESEAVVEVKEDVTPSVKEKRKERKERRKEKTVITSTPARLTPPPSLSPSLSIPVSVGVLDASPVVSLTRLPESDVNGTSKPSPIVKDPETPKIVEDRNKFPCPHCARGFRKENLLNYHLKYYHAEEGTGAPLESVVPPGELATARRRADPERKRQSHDDDSSKPPRKRARTELDRSLSDSRSSVSKRRSEDGPRPSNLLMDFKRMSTDSCEPEPAWDASLNQSDLSSSAVSNLDLSSSHDFTRDIKKERLDSAYEDFPVMSDSEFSVKTERERNDSVGIDSLVSEDQESLPGEERRGEVVNCICGYAEENGFMIQCEVCLCWQHAICIRISEDKLPAKYICWVCVNPPGVRDSKKFVHDQEWLKEGQLTKFSYLARTREHTRRAPVLKALASLLGDVHNVNAVLSGLRVTSELASRGDRPDLEQIYSTLEESVVNETVPAASHTDNKVREELQPDPAVADPVTVDSELTANQPPEASLNNVDDSRPTTVVTSPAEQTDPSVLTNENLNDHQHDSNVVPRENGETEETVVDNGETVVNDGGTVADNAGTVVDTAGTIVDNGEPVVDNGGTVVDNGESVVDRRETIVNNGEMEVENGAIDSANVNMTTDETASSDVKDTDMNNENPPQNTETTAHRPTNGTSALSDHSYQQVNERGNAEAFHHNSLTDHDGVVAEPGENTETLVEAGESVDNRCRSVHVFLSREQDKIDSRLDLLEDQIVRLEQMDAGHPVPSDFDPLMDIVSVKKSLKSLIYDLNKVKRMATYSGHRR